MKRIIVQQSFTISKAIMVSLFFAGIGVLFISNYMVISSLYKVILFLCFSIILIPVFIHCTFKQGHIISELVLTAEDLIIVHKENNKISQYQKISRKDIKSVHAVLHANENIERRIGSSRPIISRSCMTFVDINLNNGETISFEQNAGAWSLCLYSFIFRLITFAQELPNFTYKIKGNWILPQKELEYFSKYGKRMSYFKQVEVSKKYMQIK